MEGQSDVAIEAARKTGAANPVETVQQLQFLQVFWVVPYHALERFGKWEGILKQPPPTYDSPFTSGVSHYARGMAFTATRNLAAAHKELHPQQKIIRHPALAPMP